MRIGKMIMGNGVIIASREKSNHHDGITECWKLKSMSLGEVSYGITPILNFMNFRPAVHWLLNTYKWMSVVMPSGKERKGSDRLNQVKDEHAQEVTGHHNHHHSTSRIQATVTLELPSAGNMYEGEVQRPTYGITSITSLLNFRPAILYISNSSSWISCEDVRFD
jgi:hypothetical protein